MNVLPSVYVCLYNDISLFYRNGGHVKPPLHHDYLLLKKRLGPEQAAKLIRLRLMHLREMLAVASEDDILSESQCREVDSLDVYFAQEDFDEAKKQLKAWKKDMPEESKDYIALDSRESIEVILNFFYLMS